uniref:Uncharacterized protein n=1 Tax=Arundo donax TaxID=35708 RepID=A0A0A9CMW9_ARUDO
MLTLHLGQMLSGSMRHYSFRTTRSFLRRVRNQTSIKIIFITQGVTSPQTLINVLSGVLACIMALILNPAWRKRICLMVT